MNTKSFLTEDEVAEEMQIGKSKAYQIIRILNAELESMGYLTVRGRVDAGYFRKKACYQDSAAPEEGGSHGSV